MSSFVESTASTANQFQPILPIQDEYPIVLYVICPIGIIYLAIYVLLRNHYVFIPQVIKFLKRNRIKSVIINELIIDTISSLSILTFALSSIILSYSDRAISIIIQNDLYWLGLCMTLIVYRNIKEADNLEIKVVVKNGLILIGMYIVIIQQYFSMYSFLLMGLIMMGLYFFNLALKVYEEEFVRMIEVLFNAKPQVISEMTYNNANQMPKLEYLAVNFPVSRDELENKLRSFEPKLKQIKLKTKTTVTKKLLMLSLAVKMSQEKMLTKMKQEVGSYYGGLNGTTNEKMRRINENDQNAAYEEKKNYMPEKNAHSEDRKWPFEEKKLDYDYKKTHSFEETMGRNPTMEEEIAIHGLDVDDELEVLFTIFPIKLFESSKIISTLFTIILNLSFGFCLDYTISILYTLKYGRYFNFLLALLILPVLPHVSKNEYFNSMALASLWKYMLIGLFFAINVLVNGSAYINYSEQLKIQSILNLIMVVAVIIQLISNSNNSFKLFLTFFLLLVANIAVTYSYSID